MAKACSRGGHPAESLSSTLFLMVSLRGDSPAVVYRAAYCHRHGRVLLSVCYKTAVDLSAELDDPEFCFGCGRPSTDIPFGLSYYEGDWTARFAGVLCDECAHGLPSTLGEASGSPEKLPPRQNRTNRASRH